MSQAFYKINLFNSHNKLKEVNTVIILILQWCKEEIS